MNEHRNEHNRKVLVAMSGGVDSTVCAHLLKEQGYDIEGLTMKLWSDSQRICDENETVPDQNCRDAMNVAAQMNIPHHSIALGDSFRRAVVDNFISEYINGRTPNPCVECNRCIKFGKLLDVAFEMGFSHLATGHYAKIEKLDSGEYVLKKAKDTAKDQTYFLWSIKKEYLSHIIFPLGDHTKSEIRAIAEEFDYKSAKRSDSQDICFIPDQDYVSFIKSQTDVDFPRGSFISTDGKILGTHDGIINYTIGQRKGLGIALGAPAFVKEKNVKDNTVTLCSNDQLFSDSLTASELNMLCDLSLNTPVRCEVKIRYRHTPCPATVTLIGDKRIRVEFDQPQRAITSGQSVVMYDGDIVIGGAVID